jgi:rhamnosyltransferase
MVLGKGLNRNNEYCVIIVTFNPELDFLEKNLQRLLSYSMSTLIVDNFSKNIGGLLELKRKLDPHSNVIKFHFNPSNDGLGKATNCGFEYAKNNGFKYLFIFDQDTEINLNYLKDTQLAIKEVEYLSSSPAIMTALCVNKANETKEIVTTSSFNLKVLNNAIASCSLVNLDIYLKIHGQMENLFIDHVDTEWYFRAINYGFRIYAIEGDYASHKIGDRNLRFVGRDYNVHSPLRIYYRTRNTIYLSRFSYIPVYWKLRSFATMFYRVLIFTLLIKGSRLKYFTSYFNGLYDGLFLK